MKPSIQKIYDELFINFPVLVQCKEGIEDAFSALVECYRNKGKVLVCGNGGSAADAEHIVGELMKGFLLKREIPAEDRDAIAKVSPESAEFICNGLQRALPAISLVSHVSLFSAFANDVAADLVFAQQVYGYGRENDVLIGISTSGNSTNVCHAARVAKALGIKVIGLTGKKSSTLFPLCDITICAPSESTFRIQEYHQPVYHALCAMLEYEFFDK